MMVNILFCKPCQLRPPIVYPHGSRCLRSPPIMSIVTLCGAPARHGLARGGRGDTGSLVVVQNRMFRFMAVRHDERDKPLTARLSIKDNHRSSSRKHSSLRHYRIFGRSGSRKHLIVSRSVHLHFNVIGLVPSLIRSRHNILSRLSIPFGWPAR